MARDAGTSRLEHHAEGLQSIRNESHRSTERVICCRTRRHGSKLKRFDGKADNAGNRANDTRATDKDQSRPEPNSGKVRVSHGTRTERRAAARYRWDRVKVSFVRPRDHGHRSGLLAWLMYWVDLSSQCGLKGQPFRLGRTPGELRTALLSIAGTVLATAGVVFTLLTLPLSTVATQYGSRFSESSSPIEPRSSSWVRSGYVRVLPRCCAFHSSAGSGAGSASLNATVGVFLMVATLRTLILLVQHIGAMLQAPISRRPRVRAAQRR